MYIRIRADIRTDKLDEGDVAYTVQTFLENRFPEVVDLSVFEVYLG